MGEFITNMEVAGVVVFYGSEDVVWRSKLFDCRGSYVQSSDEGVERDRKTRSFVWERHCSPYGLVEGYTITLDSRNEWQEGSEGALGVVEVIGSVSLLVTWPAAG